MKKYILLTIAILSMAFAGCSKKEDHSMNQNNNANNASNAATKPAEEVKKPETETSAAAADSPTAVFTAFLEAIKKKDASGIKGAISKSSLVQMEAAAKAQKTTLEELLSDTEDVSDEKMPGVRNEKIDGETATVEVENEITKKWDSVPFVKEDGKWKIAMDKINK